MNIWTIILAAGAASRFGSAKALAPWKNGTLLSNAISIAPLSDKIVVVTGAHAEVIPHLNGVHHIHNAQWEQGMGSSISAGLQYVANTDADIAIIIPVDQPFITQIHLRKLAAQAIDENRCVLTKDGTLTGPPAAIPRHLFLSLMDLKKGGLKSALSDFGLCEGSGLLCDIDTPEDLNHFKETN